MSLERDIDLLSRVPVFSELSHDHLRLLAFSGVRRDLQPDETLFRRGEAAQSGFVVSFGRIVLFEEGEKRRRVLATCEEGSLIGELALFVETTRPAHAAAAVESGVIELSRTLVMRMLSEYPHVALRLRTILSQRLRATVGELGAVTEALSEPDERDRQR